MLYKADASSMEASRSKSSALGSSKNADREEPLSTMVFGTLLVPALSSELAIALETLRLWRVVTFTQMDDVFECRHAGSSILVDFASAPFPFIDAAAILFADDTEAVAETFATCSGLVLQRRRVALPLGTADHAWLDDLSAERFGSMMNEFNNSQAEVMLLRQKVDDLRSGFTLLETYLTRNDVPSLRKVWHAPFVAGAELDVTKAFRVVLPCSSWGVTRLQIWIARTPEGADSRLSIELKALDTGDIIETWSTSFAEIGHRRGWMSYDLDVSLVSFAQPLGFAVVGKGWRLGGAAPWIAPNGPESIASSNSGPALRIYATIPGFRGPNGISVPVDDRRSRWLLAAELASARPLAVPPDLGFLPVTHSERGLLVHPVAKSPMVAVITDACPPWTATVRLSIRHDHTEGDPFLVTATHDLNLLDSSGSRAGRAGEAGVVCELGPVTAGAWVRLDAGASARVEFTFTPQQRRHDLYIATCPVEDGRASLAWAIVTGVEVVLADG